LTLVSSRFCSLSAAGAMRQSVTDCSVGDSDARAELAGGQPN
jgi:hypothetical protein